VTAAPLAGLQLARETGHTLAWDNSRNVYRIDAAGNLAATWTAPEAIETAAISDTASAVAVLSERGTLWWLDAELSNPLQQGVVRKPSALALDPHGQYALLSSLLRTTFVIDRYGKLVTELETSRPLVLTMFLLAEPYWIGAADHGLLGAYTLEGEPQWQDRLWSSVGALAATASGHMILAACYGHGIQRYGLRGDNEGAYQLPGPVRHVACPVDGSAIAATTLEARLTMLDQSGRIQWDAALDETAAGLAVDALGRYLIVGLPAGQIARWDLVPEGEAPIQSEATPAASVADSGAPALAPPREKQPRGGGARRAILRDPDWTTKALRSADDARVAVVDVLDSPLRIALFTADRRLMIFDPTAPPNATAGPMDGGAAVGVEAEPGPIHVSERLSGRGRMLRAVPGYVVAATDQQVLVYRAHDNASMVLPTRLVDISHVVLASERAVAVAASFASAPDRFLVEFPPVPGIDDFRILIVESRDRLSSLRPSGEVVWTRDLETSVQEIASAAEDAIGLTTDDGWLVVYNEDGERRGRRRSQPAEPMALALIMDASGRFQFATTAPQARLARAYDHDANETWWRPVPFQPWRLVAAGPFAVVLSDDGSTVALDAQGTSYLGPAGVPTDARFFPLDAQGVPPVAGSDRSEAPKPRGHATGRSQHSGPGTLAARRTVPIGYLFADRTNLTCADWGATVRWRHVASAAIGPTAHSDAGTAALLGKQLAWFAGP
jgi:hypothetical protein